MTVSTSFLTTKTNRVVVSTLHAHVVVVSIVVIPCIMLSRNIEIKMFDEKLLDVSIKDHLTLAGAIGKRLSLNLSETTDVSSLLNLLLLLSSRFPHKVLYFISCTFYYIRRDS